MLHAETRWMRGLQSVLVDADSKQPLYPSALSGLPPAGLHLSADIGADLPSAVLSAAQSSDVVVDNEARSVVAAAQGVRMSDEKHQSWLDRHATAESSQVWSIILMPLWAPVVLAILGYAWVRDKISAVRKRRRA